MPLLTRKTDLKSLKYGQDTPGGGNSGQPYIQSRIPEGENATVTFDDGFVRGGFVGAARASLVDTKRIFSFLKDLPKGPLFIARQVGLQFSNPRLETKKLGTGIGFLDNSINFVRDNLGLQPTRIYNLGINTLAQVPVNAFGVHFNRHGLLPVQDSDTKYLAVAQYNNTQQGGKNNRLVLLANKFNLGKNDSISLNPKETKVLFNTLFTAGETAANVVFNDILQPIRTSRIDDYFGGPNSVYGIGRTLIRRYDNTQTDKTSLALERSRNVTQLTKIDYSKTLGVSKQYFPSNDIDTPKPDIATYGSIVTQPIPLTVNAKNEITSDTLAGIKGRTSVKNASYQTYQKLIESKQLRERTYTLSTSVGSEIVNTFGIYGNNNYNSIIGGTVYNNILPDSSNIPIYSNGDKIIEINIPWNKATREERVGNGTQDQINLTPIFNAPAGTIGDTVTIPGVGDKKINDLVKFRIQALNGDDPLNADWMIFRAYVTQFSDSVDAKWNPVQYAGRGEELYIYGGFGRKVSIGFKVAALSEEEMKPMYQKLNYLMGNLMPDYKGLLMRGPLIKMTVGNWFDGQDGILNSLSYNVPNDSPWEIGLPTSLGGAEPLILPHIVEVQMTFTPIGSQTKNTNKISSKAFNTSHIAQNVNDIQYITGNIPQLK